MHHMTELLTTETKTNSPEWFAISVLPGQEKHIAQALLRRVPGVKEAVVPSEIIKKNNRLGQKITVDKLIFPGYAFIRASLQDDEGAMNGTIYERVLGIHGVRDFVGTVRSTQFGMSTTVTPMTEVEMQGINAYMARNAEEGGRIENAFQVEETVRVTGGSFMGFEGIITRVDNERGKANVSIKVFGRETDVEISTVDIERVAQAGKL
jgi:transcription termination/antitermination protein NusG